MNLESAKSRVQDGTGIFTRLVRSCVGREQEFRCAAARAADPAIQRLFLACARQQQRFAAELRMHARDRLPVLDDSNPTGLGDEDLCESATELMGLDPVEGCLRREQEAIRLYEAALGAALPVRTQFIIASQLALLRQAHDRIVYFGDAQPVNGGSIIDREGHHDLETYSGAHLGREQRRLDSSVEYQSDQKATH